MTVRFCLAWLEQVLDSIKQNYNLRIHGPTVQPAFAFRFGRASSPTVKQLHLLAQRSHLTGVRDEE